MKKEALHKDLVNLRVDGHELELPRGANLLDSLREAGFEIPSMCHLKGLPHQSACMMCVVKLGPQQRLRPSCSLKVEEGMEIISRDEEITGARKVALELMLSEHVGDCEAPCQISCPAHMDIPRMNRLLAEGRNEEAYRVVLQDIALPSVLGRICPAPCEGACRRKDADQAVSICLLKRYAGDQALENKLHIEAPARDKKAKKVAVIGAGPAGLAVLFHLALKGYACTLFDRQALAGGSLLQETGEEELPRKVVAEETGRILDLAAELRLGSDVDAAELKQIQMDHDAVVLATGKSGLAAFNGLDSPGILEGPGDLDLTQIEKKTYQYKDQPLFVVGSALRHARMAVRALGQGKEAACSVDQFLRGEEVRGEPRMFNSRFGRLQEQEVEEYLKESTRDKRFEPRILAEGFSTEEVQKEAARCMHCDCRDQQHCQLRHLSEIYGASQRAYRSGERIMLTKNMQHETLIFEDAKCIKCGLCVRLCEQQQEALGLTFVGRGFDLRVAVPFQKDMQAAIGALADKVAMNCPTGALQRNEH